ncbi:MAG: hypothetical protein H8E86_05080 [Planctomycetes bacterium]|nr:hypothetical protein [Planctomycetota bacterium]
MFPKLTTILLLSAITVQAVFGGLQNTVSICLGGGHEHEIAEVVEHCSMECSHHSSWPAPIAEVEDIDNCDCTDLELALITLLSVPRDDDDTASLTIVFQFLNTQNVNIDTPCNTTWLAVVDYPPVSRQQLVVMRKTRLLL